MDSDDEAELFRCAICGTSQDDSSNLTQSALQTNATVGCGHQFCMSCVESYLARSKSFSCPLCGTEVKRTTLSTRTLDDHLCEKDSTWRRRVLKVFNKVESDFLTLKEYNDYLEEVEDLIYAIVNEEPNADECRAKVKTYEEEHKSEIIIRQSRRADENRSIADRIAAEQRDAEMRKRQFLEEKRAIALEKKRYKHEATQVLVGEREEVSRELVAAHMQGYKHDTKQLRNRTPFAQESRVREPNGGLHKDIKLDKEEYLKRQAAGGGIAARNTQTHDRNWQLAVSTLFYSSGYTDMEII